MGNRLNLKFYFSLVVWGKDYVDMLLKVALPSFLAPRNIPGLVNLAESKFIFATTHEDYELISRSEIFKLLRQHIQPVFIDIGQEKYLDNRYARMTYGYELATHIAIEDQAYMVYLVPDAILSNGSILKLEEYACQNRQVVLIPGPRVIKEKLMDHVKSLGFKTHEALSLSARDLVKLGQQMFHRQFKHYAMDGDQFTKWPHLVTWQGPHEGLLIRSFHLHPLMVNCACLSENISFDHHDTIDRNFIRDNFLDLNTFLIEGDSDNILMYSMAEEDERIEYGFWDQASQKTKAVIAMSQSNLVNELQKHYFYYAYKLHANDLTSEWFELEKQTMSLVFAVIQPKKIYYKKPYFYQIFRSFLGRFFSEEIKNKIKYWYWKGRKWVLSANFEQN